MPQVKRGEIWDADLEPVRGSEQGGTRPVLVLQNDLGNAYSATTIIAAISSAPASAYPFHVRLGAGNGGLSRDSAIKLEHIRTIALERLSRKRGALTSDQMTLVDRALHHSLGLRCELDR